MPIDLALAVGVLFAAGLYLVLGRCLVRAIFGLVLLSNAANLSVLLLARDPSGLQPPIVSTPGPWVDPLPQALVLTAIVIGFGMTAYLGVLIYRLFIDRGTTDLDEGSES